MLRDDATILDIIEAANAGHSYILGMGKGDFFKDRRTQKAVIYEIQTIGEAVKRLSKEFCALHPGIPWADMAGMRDKLVHDYDHVDLNRVWFVIANRIPELLQLLEPIRKKILEDNPSE